MCKTLQKWSSGRNLGLFLVIEVLLCMLYTSKVSETCSFFTHILFFFFLDVFIFLAVA